MGGKGRLKEINIFGIMTTIVWFMAMEKEGVYYLGHVFSDFDGHCLVREIPPISILVGVVGRILMLRVL